MRMLIQMSTILVLTTITAAVAAGPKKCRGDNPTKCRRGKGGIKLKNSQKPTAPHWGQEPPKNGQLDVRENTSVTLMCEVKGWPAPAINWTAGRKRINKAEGGKYRLKKAKQQLIIRNIKMADSGPYTCVAENNLGRLNYTYHIKVLENMPLGDIDVVDRPENQTAHVGDTVIFQCTSHDWPEPKVFWTRRHEKRGVVEAIGSSDSNNGALVLHNVTEEDEGEYTCTIENGSVHKEYSGTLTVIEAGESLPFEPGCSLHIRREVILDHANGCHTAEPVEMHYCMGSCGRSYYIPKMVVSDQDTPTDKDEDFLSQTCKCCVGKVKALRIVDLECNFGKKKRGFYTLLNGCECQACATKGDDLPSNKKNTTTRRDDT